MGMDLARDVAKVVRLGVGHVTILATLRLGWVIERARAKAGDSAGLPVVVLVEASEPAVIVHRNIEVHLVTRRAEFRRLLLHEWLQEDTPVRLRIQLDAEVVYPSQYRVLGGRELVQLRILEHEVTLPHGALHAH